MEELTNVLNNCGNTDNSQFNDDESPLPPTFVYNTPIILGVSDIIKLFEEGLYKCEDDAINRYYYYLRNVESPFKEWDNEIQLAYDLSRLLEPEPSDNYLPYYKSKKMCFCCHCLGWICLCKYIVDNYNDATLFKKIEEKFELYLKPKRKKSTVFYDFLRVSIINLSFENSKELLKRFLVAPEAQAPISDIMNDFELFKNKAIKRFQAKYRPSLYVWLAEHVEIISEQQIADFFAVLVKHNVPQTLKDIKSQKSNNRLEKEQPDDSPQNDHQCTNDTPPKKRKDLSHFAPYTPKDNYDVPVDDLFKYLKNKEGKLCGVDYDYFRQCIYCGDFTSLYNNDEDEAKTHIKVLIRYLHKHFNKRWFESSLKSCGLKTIKINTTKDNLKSDIEGIIEGRKE